MGETIAQIRHAYTHFRITLHVFEAVIQSGEPRAIECADWRWASLSEMSAYAFPVTDQKIIEILSKEGRLL